MQLLGVRKCRETVTAAAAGAAQTAHEAKQLAAHQAAETGALLRVPLSSPRRGRAALAALGSTGGTLTKEERTCKSRSICPVSGPGDFSNSSKCGMAKGRGKGLAAQL